MSERASERERRRAIEREGEREREREREGEREKERVCVCACERDIERERERERERKREKEKERGSEVNRWVSSMALDLSRGSSCRHCLGLYVCRGSASNEPRIHQRSPAVFQTFSLDLAAGACCAELCYVFGDTIVQDA